MTGTITHARFLTTQSLNSRKFCLTQVQHSYIKSFLDPQYFLSNRGQKPTYLNKVIVEINSEIGSVSLTYLWSRMSKIFSDSDYSKFRDFSACWFCFLLFISKLSMTNPSLSKRVKNFQFQSKYHATRKNPIWKRFWITHFSTIKTIQVDGKNTPQFFLVKSKLSTA